MKKGSRLQLFRVVRKGYDPEEVLNCFQDLVLAFSHQEKEHVQKESAYLQENLQLRLELDKGRVCIENLQEQIDSLMEEKQRLIQKLAQK